LVSTVSSETLLFSSSLFCSVKSMCPPLSGGKNKF